MHINDFSWPATTKNVDFWMCHRKNRLCSVASRFSLSLFPNELNFCENMSNVLLFFIEISKTNWLKIIFLVIYRLPLTADVSKWSKILWFLIQTALYEFEKKLELKALLHFVLNIEWISNIHGLIRTGDAK